MHSRETESPQAARLGEHTDETSREAGYDHEDVARLRTDGIVG